MKKLKKMKVVIKGEVELDVGVHLADDMQCVKDIIDSFAGVGTVTDVSYEGE